jgi:hypothetical protein
MCHWHKCIDMSQYIILMLYFLLIAVASTDKKEFVQ